MSALFCRFLPSQYICSNNGHMATDRPVYSFKDLVYILTLAFGFFIQHFTLKMEIHDAVVEQSFNKREMSAEIASIELRTRNLESNYDFLCKSNFMPADKPKQIKIEEEK